ncbi:hypothetical protein BDR26DRAFT_832677 [Obelidium mucronatum]|nr:hypothetical protein BDR26DRAFT_832677 [Obelidium mucronatum]
MGAKNIKSTLINQMKFDAQKSIQLSSAAISKVVSASNDHSAMAVENSNDSNKPKPLLFSPAYQPPEWKFKLNLPQDPSLPSDKNDPSFVTLTTCSIIRRPGFPTFLLDGEYTLKSTLPRSYFNILHSHTVQHNFVFNFTNPEHTLFKEMAGLRKTGYFNIKEAGSNEEWELHLKQSRERTNFFGYLVRASDLRNFIQQRMAMIVASRKLPLVLDLDDTLVRMIGNEEGRYVPPQQALQVPERVRTLTDGRRVVLTERVEEFLQWAQRYFEISVCSVGDQPYVDMVIGVLDPQRSNIRGQGYSARAEFMHIQGTSMSKRPPKDLDSLFVFPQKSLDPTGLFCGPFVDPLVIDDNVGMWPVEQQDNIIVVREQKGAKVWNVQLFPHVQTVLQSVHTEFFKQLDNWDHKNAGPANLGPSSRQIYKEFLRNEYARRMAEPVATMTIQQQQQHPQQQSLGGGMSISPPPVAAAALRATPSSIPVVVGPPAASDIGISGLASLVSPLIHSLQQHHGGGGTGVSSIAVNPVASPLVGTFTLPDD